LEYFIEAFFEAFRLITGFDSDVYGIVFVSLKVSIYAVALAAAAGVPLGVCIAMRDFPGKQGVLLGLNTLMALPTVVVGLMLYALLSRRGVLGDLELLFSPAGITMGLFVLILPLVINLSISAIQGVDPRLPLTCRSLGGTAFQTSVMVLKEAKFAVLAAIVVAFGRVVSEVGIAMMLGGNIRGHTRTMTTAIALETGKGEFALGLALGIVLLCVAFVVNAVLFILQKKRG
jgi:tungstate transport system permease protein